MADPRVHYTARAANQIIALADHVSEAYLIELRATILQASHIVTVGTRVADRPDVYRVRAKRHWIYYRATPDGIRVLRLVHTSRKHGHL
jgi:plasmid stabilization system protein ParE